MKKLTKFLALSPIAILAMGGAAALAISCGESDADPFAFEPSVSTSQTIPILVDARSADKQTLAWRTVVDKYNSSLLNGAKTFSVETFENNIYTSNSLGQSMLDAYNAKDTWRFNLIYGYPQPLARVATLGRMLPLVAPGDVASTRNLFNKDVISANDQIANAEANNFYILPLAKSSEALYINKPLAARLFKVAKDNNYLSLDSARTAKINALIKEQEDLGASGDYAYLSGTDTPWKTVATITPPTTLAAGLNKFDDSVFTDAAALLDFSSTIRGLFAIPNTSITTKNPTTGVEVTIDYTDNDYNIFGADSGANFLFSNTTALAKTTSENQDFSKTLWGIGADRRPSYSFLTDSASEARRNFTTVYNAVKRGIETKGVYFKVAQGGSSSSDVYPTVPLQQHRLAFALGSTSGYLYANTGATPATGNVRTTLQSEEMQLNTAPKLFTADSSPVNILQGRSVFGYSSKDPAVNDAIQKFIKWMLEARLDWEETSIDVGGTPYPISAASQATPGERFNQIAGYLYATKDNVSKELDPKIFNAGVIQVAHLVRDSNDPAKPESKVFLLEDPINIYSNFVRAGIEGAVVSDMKQALITPGATGSQVSTVLDKIYKDTPIPR